MICGFLAAVAYGSMAGWPLPAIRAAVMFGAAALAWCLAVRTEPVNTLLAALGLILLFDPSAIASLSLWLSFVATAALLLWARKQESEESFSPGLRLAAMGKTILWVSLLATLATLPMIVASFGRIPVYSLPANMIMVPLYALIVMPAGLLAEVLALFGLHGMGEPLMQLAGAAVEMGIRLLTFISNLPAGQLWAAHPSVWMQLLYGVGMVWCGVMLWRGKRFKAALSAMLVLTLWLSFVLHETDVGEAQWIVWDVGQGAASTLLLPGNRVIAVDAPGRAGSRFNGGTIEASGLRSLGITHINILALSHAQSDHLGGAISLMKNINSIGELWLPDVPSARSDRRVSSIVAYAQSRGASIRWLAKGDVVDIGNDSQSSATVNVLWPPRGFNPANANNTSLVLSVHLGKRLSMLWPGDIEAEAETAMLASGMKKTGMMLMPHHGSNTSSQMRFIEALHPSLAI
ncbi:MAG: ComEC/Rec2 family competence protein, partial [Mariprofundaceae bacterium]|nr:ComEC/Rec2 family competence protein [Mariprofundaceae bacterium]